MLHIDKNEGSKKKPQKQAQEYAGEAGKSVVMFYSEQRKYNFGVQTKQCEHKKHASQKQASQIILAIAQIYMMDVYGKQHACRVLLDPGSQANLITEEMIQMLRLPSRKESVAVHGVMKRVTDFQ